MSNLTDARARLAAYVSHESDADQAEFLACVDAVVAAETAELRARVTELEADSRLLSALEVAGVDNWEGYDDALEGCDFS